MNEATVTQLHDAVGRCQALASAGAGTEATRLALYVALMSILGPLEDRPSTSEFLPYLIAVLPVSEVNGLLRDVDEALLHEGG
jgi:hypothetical protein